MSALRRIRQPGFRWAAGGLLLIVALCDGAEAATRLRPFTVDDLFELEDVGQFFGGPYAFSEDGKRLAITRVRPSKTVANHRVHPWGNCADVWVQADPDVAPVNITNGAEDGSCWWSTQWSPDGRRLAMLSTRGGGARLWIWDVGTRQLRQLSTYSVSMNDFEERPYLWLNSNRLLFPALIAGESPAILRQLQTPTIASAAWSKVAAGEVSTASVLESGLAADMEARAQEDLVAVDAASGAETLFAHGNTRSRQMSPDGKAVAFARQVSVYRPNKDDSLKPGFNAGIFSIDVRTRDGTVIAFQGEISTDIGIYTLRWSPDGQELAFVGFPRDRARAPMLYRLGLAKRTVGRFPLTDLDAVSFLWNAWPTIEWTASGDLVLVAAKLAEGGKSSALTRKDAWLLTRGGRLRNLTEATRFPPDRLWPYEGRNAFFGWADGEIWRLDLLSAQVTNLTKNFEPRIESIAWPRRNGVKNQISYPGSTYSQLLVNVWGEAGPIPYRLDLRSNAISPLRPPARAAELVAYSPAGTSALFHSNDRNGLFLWQSNLHTGKTRTLIEANGFLCGIVSAEFKAIEYTSLNGEKLKAWLMLPLGYERGKRYPLLTWIYPGRMVEDQPPDDMGINSSSIFNMQIATARGYAVLLPSMPMSEDWSADDPMLRLPEGVLPAVDKVIEMQIADPQRLFLMGHSFGGFGTYGLITQMHRFKAAVSLAGPSNIVSTYGQFDAGDRYGNFPHENLFLSVLMETGQFRLNNPPWKDWARYIRNSPIFYVDRVQTPLMIIHGDLDFVGIEQGEEFFRALYRQGKRAEFVRYWGEAHVLQSPANIRDMWQRMFDWFEKNAAPGSAAHEN